jgi:hypothetical protein
MHHTVKYSNILIQSVHIPACFDGPVRRTIETCRNMECVRILESLNVWCILLEIPYKHVLEFSVK